MSDPLMVIPRPGSELKAVEQACREASRTIESLTGLNGLNKVSGSTVSRGYPFDNP